MKTDTKKYRTITADLLQKIRSGELKPGDRILAERPLAEQYGVARLTARRALCDLEERGLVKRDGRRGTTVLHHLETSKAQTLTLLCSAAPSSLVEETIRFTLQKVRERQYVTRVIRVMENDEKPMLEALKLGNPTLVFGWPQDISPSGKLEKAIRRAGPHVAIIAGIIDGCEIPTVTCDDKEGMHLAIQTLKDAGHSHIALIAPSMDPTHPVASQQIKIWWEHMRPTMDPHQLHDNLIALESIYAENALITMYERLQDYLKSPASQKITAMICLTEELATAAVAACRETGRAVPEKMSIMEYAWTQRSELANPPRTGVCTHLDRHVDKALDLLDQLRAGKSPKKLHHLVKPELMVRETIAPPYVAQ